MCFVDNYKGAAQPQHIGQRTGRGAFGTDAFSQQLVALGRRQIVEMVHQRAAALVHLAGFLVLHLKRLPGGDDDGGRGVQRGAGDALGLVQIQHRDWPCLAQCRVVRVQAVAQAA